MKPAHLSAAVLLLSSGIVQAKPFHDEIPEVFRGTWATTSSGCSDPNGVEQFVIDGDSVNYYEGNDYLLLGVKYWGEMTKGGGSGSLFNGRFTGRTETALLGESSVRMEIDDRNKSVLHRYPIGDDGEPIASREVRSVRCVALK